MSLDWMEIIRYQHANYKHNKQTQNYPNKDWPHKQVDFWWQVGRRFHQGCLVMNHHTPHGPKPSCQPTCWSHHVSCTWPCFPQLPRLRTSFLHFCKGHVPCLPSPASPRLKAMCSGTLLFAQSSLCRSKCYDSTRAGSKSAGPHHMQGHTPF